MPIISGGGGGGGAASLAAVLAVGHDAAGAGMDNLGDSTMQGGSWIFDGDNEEYPRGPGTEAAQTGGAAASIYFGTPPGGGLSGAELDLTAGFAQANGRTGGHLKLEAGSGLTAGGGATVGALLQLTRGDASAAGRLAVRTAASNGALGETLIATGTELLYGDLGGIKNDTHAAPADGVLAAGDLYLWFDQTNGAAKLMAKAKTADGTVVTAAIALA